MRLYQMADPVRYPTMTPAELRQTFLVDNLYAPGQLNLIYADIDRTVLGLAAPTASPLTLDTHPELRADFFLQRRELGVLNIGGPGSVTVDGSTHQLNKLDALYIGRGSRSVSFASADPATPAVFYLLSYQAHTTHPTTQIPFKTMQGTALGATEAANKRTVYKAIHRDGAQSCQLVMGFTLLNPGSVWNTMPAHTHMRRSEVYLYFNLDPAHRILHLMGPPNATSHIVVQDKEVVISPGWSIHAGVGTSNYAFCWGMGGENQDYADMDPAPITELK